MRLSGGLIARAHAESSVGMNSACPSDWGAGELPSPARWACDIPLPTGLHRQRSYGLGATGRGGRLREP